jgi:hypothetical protein
MTTLTRFADVAELLSSSARNAIEYGRPGDLRGGSALRPVYCPSCGRHFTTVKGPFDVWTPSVRHVECGCKGGAT